MSYLDAPHHIIAERLIKKDLQIKTIEASEDDDKNFVADRYMLVGNKQVRLGLKNRGPRAGTDYNLSAWSFDTNKTLEIGTAGGKHYFYTFPAGKNRQTHVLVQFKEQHLLDALQPVRWTPIRDGVDTKWINYPTSLVRARSEGKDSQQGVIYVPSELVIPRAIWDDREKLQWIDEDWLRDLKAGK